MDETEKENSNLSTSRNIHYHLLDNTLFSSSSLTCTIKNEIPVIIIFYLLLKIFTKKWNCNQIRFFPISKK